MSAMSKTIGKNTEMPICRAMSDACAKEGSIFAKDYPTDKSKTADFLNSV
jgi:hypothetical protein